MTGAWFQLPARHKSTWQHPRSKHWHQLEHVLVRRRDLSDVQITRAMPGADDCWTDHRLVVCKLGITLRRCMRGPVVSPPVKHFNCRSLSDSHTAHVYADQLHNKIQQHCNIDHPSTEDEWTSLKHAITSVAEETIGFAKSKHKD